jgi:hypothetical protein
VRHQVEEEWHLELGLAISTCLLHVQHSAAAAPPPENQDDHLANCCKEVFKEMSPTNDLEEDTFEEEMNHHFEHKFNWTNILKQQGLDDNTVKQIGSDGRHWLKNLNTICRAFDIMDWWEDHCKDKFPQICVIACLILPLPDNNGNQERTFSACTWMDRKLQKNQGEGTFQTKCVLHKTKELRDMIAKHMIDDKEIHTK